METHVEKLIARAADADKSEDAKAVLAGCVQCGQRPVRDGQREAGREQVGYLNCGTSALLCEVGPRHATGEPNEP
jgi:hypothetical protein